MAERASRFPGLTRLPGRAERFLEPVTGEVYSRRTAEKYRGTPLPKRKAPPPRKALPGGYRDKFGWKGGKELHSTGELRRFVQSSRTDCLYDDFLLAGERPSSQFPETAPEGFGYTGPTMSDVTGPGARIPGVPTGQGRAYDKSYLLHIIDESKDLKDVITKLRPDLDLTDAKVYGWSFREGPCP